MLLIHAVKFLTKTEAHGLVKLKSLIYAGVPHLGPHVPHLVPCSTGHAPCSVRGSGAPDLRRLYQKAAAPRTGRSAAPARGNAVAPPSVTSFNWGMVVWGEGGGER